MITTTGEWDGSAVYRTCPSAARLFRAIPCSVPSLKGRENRLRFPGDRMDDTFLQTVMGHNLDFMDDTHRRSDAERRAEQVRAGGAGRQG